MLGLSGYGSSDEELEEDRREATSKVRAFQLYITLRRTGITTNDFHAGEAYYY